MLERYLKTEDTNDINRINYIIEKYKPTLINIYINSREFNGNNMSPETLKYLINELKGTCGLCWKIALDKESGVEIHRSIANTVSIVLPHLKFKLPHDEPQKYDYHYLHYGDEIDKFLYECWTKKHVLINIDGYEIEKNAHNSYYNKKVFMNDIEYLYYKTEEKAQLYRIDDTLYMYLSTKKWGDKRKYW